MSLYWMEQRENLAFSCLQLAGAQDVLSCYTFLNGSIHSQRSEVFARNWGPSCCSCYFHWPFFFKSWRRQGASGNIVTDRSISVSRLLGSLEKETTTFSSECKYKQREETNGDVIRRNYPITHIARTSCSRVAGAIINFYSHLFFFRPRDKRKPQEQEHSFPFF